MDDNLLLIITDAEEEMKKKFWLQSRHENIFPSVLFMSVVFNSLWEETGSAWQNVIFSAAFIYIRFLYFRFTLLPLFFLYSSFSPPHSSILSFFSVNFFHFFIFFSSVFFLFFFTNVLRFPICLLGRLFLLLKKCVSTKNFIKACKRHIELINNKSLENFKRFLRFLYHFSKFGTGTSAST